MNSSNLMFIILLILSSYLLGSLPSGFLAGKWIKNIDLREIGSGSTGATNVLRHVGKIPALFVFIIDVSKGMIPIIICKVFDIDEILQITAGIASLTGHIWPLWLNWKGGKAVATGLGVFLAISWQVGFATLGIFLLIFSLSRIVSLASVIAAISLPILMYLSLDNRSGNYAYLTISIISTAMILWRHRSNLQRLIKGQEPKIGRRSN